MVAGRTSANIQPATQNTYHASGQQATAASYDFLSAFYEHVLHRTPRKKSVTTPQIETLSRGHSRVWVGRVAANRIENGIADSHSNGYNTAVPICYVREPMMKSLAVFVFIFLVAASAQAALMISVNGVIEPPLGEVVLQPNETAVIGIYGDAKTEPLIFLYLFVEGPGSIDGHTMVYRGSPSAYAEWPCADCLYTGSMDPEEVLERFEELSGLSDLTDLSLIILADDVIPPAPLDGLLVDDIIFHCDGLGDITLSLVRIDDFAIVYDTQVIQQIPEPMTLFLLGLGGLFAVARRRRKQEVSLQLKSTPSTGAIPDYERGFPVCGEDNAPGTFPLQI